MENTDHPSHQNSDDDELLYHYTDIKGLMGIIESNSIWASNIHYLNDSLEYKFAAQVVRIISEPARIFGDDKTKSILEELIKYTDNLTRTHAYVACFSKTADDLSQWRAYAHGGPGYCIAFKKSTLEATAAVHNLHFLDCRYHDTASITSLEDLIKDIRSFSLGESITSLPNNFFEAAHVKDNELMQFALSLKHHKFAAEQEVRLTTKYMGGDPNLRPKFRRGANLVIPHISIPLPDTPPSPYKEIMVGPCPDPGLARSAIGEMIVAYGLQGTDYTISEVPYRNW